MVDVTHVELHAGFEGRVFARGYLPQAGHSRHHFEALFMPCTVLLHILERVWTRADQAHVAFEDVPELRQLVQAVFAKKAAERCDARVIGNFEERASSLVQMTQFSSKAICSLDHRAEFVASKGNAVFPDSKGCVNGRAARLQSYGDGD